MRALLPILVFSFCAHGSVLRVCSDPNNLPFSNRAGQGYENKVAELIARELHANVEYTWWLQRRNFVKNTLNSGRCDVLIGMPAGIPSALTTRPYYRSTYVFVYRKDRGYKITSLNDPILRKLRIGVQVVDDNYSPPALALVHRGVRDLKGYSLLGSQSEPNPPARIVNAVAKGEIDVAIVWGPLGGYFARHESTPLVVTPVSPAHEGAVPFTFGISAAVRKDNPELRARIDAILSKDREEIRRILASYGVPFAPSHQERP
jgi:mxaJ protein